MAESADPLLSAQVVLKDPVRGQQVATEFRRLGFDVGNLVGTSFAVTAPRSRFQTQFGTEVVSDGRGSWRRKDGDAYELPVQGLPDAVRGLVDVVTFTRAPDFGPTSW